MALGTLISPVSFFPGAFSRVLKDIRLKPTFFSFPNTPFDATERFDRGGVPSALLPSNMSSMPRCEG